MPQRIPARIEFLRFTYADPAVSVTTEQRTVEHETIDDQIVVQALGRKPDQISIEGVVPAYELPAVDQLTRVGVVELRTERWKGDIIVKSTSSDFKRAKNKNGVWLYDVTIDCVEVDEQYEDFEEVLEQAQDRLDRLNREPELSSVERGALIAQGELDRDDIREDGTLVDGALEDE